MITLATYGTDLSSRVTGVAVRDAMVSALENGAPWVSVDCSGIRTLSEFFADEVFGILVAEHGKQWFKLLEAEAFRCHYNENNLRSDRCAMYRLEIQS